MSGLDGKGRLVLVLDTSAILSGFAGHVADASIFTTSEVLSELPNETVDSSTSLPLLNKASIEVMAPNETSLKLVDETAKKAGETSLSSADRSLLALALELKRMNYMPVLVTDDYGIQNIAEMLGLSYQPYVEKGIRRRYNWNLKCSGCYREYYPSPRLDVCPVCGTKLKRKIAASRKIRRH